MMPTRFMAKRWIFYPQAIAYGTFAVFGFTFGTLCLNGYRKPNGELATELGIPMLLIGLVCLALLLFILLNILIRRRPVLELFREGIQFTPIGTVLLDPVWVRAGWKLWTGRSPYNQVVRIPWSRFQATRLLGVPLIKFLAIDYRLTSSIQTALEDSGLEPGPLVIQDVRLAQRIDQIAEAISDAANNHGDLPSWDDF